MSSSPLIFSFLITLIYQAAFFSIAIWFKFDKVTDFAGTTNFILIAIVTFLLYSTFEIRQIIVTLMIIIWGIRLASFLLNRILAWGHDNRFNKIRTNIVRFAIFWLIQALWCWIGCLPLTLLNSSNLTNYQKIPLSKLELLSIFLYSFGLIFESISDSIKLNFKSEKKNKDKWCNIGPWSWSRHPNYFGEITLWWAIFLSTAQIHYNNSLSTLLIALLSPLFITFLLLFLSGIPLLEKSANFKFGTLKEFKNYKQSTSILIPFPPSLYVQFPTFVKKFIFLDFDRYNQIKK
eukprot:TRINITY_DN7681_c0_g2_i1.p1 TRINITY_DN7681_c0_g2~~TRINITY_DN7681_c0_g2_i1.p1  ORF type:complete len:291 (+),score=72.09 TRINITY_DN7681_c0_g2_i1:49-921(+)